jgi:hypothetical protein
VEHVNATRSAAAGRRGAWTAVLAGLLASAGSFAASTARADGLQHYLVLFANVQGKAGSKICSEEEKDMDVAVDASGKRFVFYWDANPCYADNKETWPWIHLQGALQPDGRVRVWGEIGLRRIQVHNESDSNETLKKVDETRDFFDLPIEINLPLDAGAAHSVGYRLMIVSHL